MTIFTVLAHGDPATFKLLANCLHPHLLLAHIDARSDISLFTPESNVRFVRDRIPLHWGGFSIVEATLRLYKQALQFAANDEYIVLLSGQCLPIRPVKELQEFLDQHSGRQYCRAGLLLDGSRKNENRIRQSWYLDKYDARVPGIRHATHALFRHGLKTLIPRRRISAFANTTVAAGSQWTALTARCLRSILEQNELYRQTQSLLRNSMAPDEIFFHTLVHTSKWGRTTLTPEPQPKAHHPTAYYANLHHIDPSLTRYLTVDDLPDLLQEDVFFARKFSVSKDSRLETVFRTIHGLPSRREFLL